VSRDFPGYYVTRNADTIRCNVEFNDWSTTPDSVKIKTATNSAILYAADVAGFGIEGYGDYRSFEIKYHKGNYTDLEAPDKYDDEVTTKQSFLKVLVNGKVSLYELTESSRAYYFVAEDNQPRELLYRVKRVDMSIDRDETYKRTLFELFSKQHIAHHHSGTITKMVYSSRHIVPLIRKLNENITGIKLKAKKQALTQLDVYVGGLTYEFPTAVPGHYSYPSNAFERTSSITGGINFMYFIPGNFRRAALGVSTGFMSFSSNLKRSDSIVTYRGGNNYNTKKYDEDLSINNKVINIDIYGMYILNPLSRAKVYLKAGFNSNFRISKSGIEVDYVSHTAGVSSGAPFTASESGTNSIALAKTYYNVHGGIGVNSGRHKVEFTYFTPGVLNRDYSFKVKMMAVYYYYTVFK
jgi:hypothetical protein